MIREILHPDVELENKASVARDHMANERTYLAWLRLSLMFTSAGVAMVQLFRLTTSADANTGSELRISNGGRAIGCLFVTMGLVVIVVACLRFFRVQKVLQTGKFPTAHRSIFFAFAVTLLLIMAALGILISAAVN